MKITPFRAILEQAGMKQQLKASLVHLKIQYFGHAVRGSPRNIVFMASWKGHVEEEHQEKSGWITDRFKKR